MKIDVGPNFYGDLKRHYALYSLWGIAGSLSPWVYFLYKTTPKLHPRCCFGFRARPLRRVPWVPLPVASSSLRPLSRSLLGIASEILRLWLMLAPAFSFPLLTRLVLSIVDEASTGEGLRGKLGTANMSGTLKVAGEGKISGSSSGKLELRML